jgi:hypothetical protein
MLKKLYNKLEYHQPDIAPVVPGLSLVLLMAWISFNSILVVLLLIALFGIAISPLIY